MIKLIGALLLVCFSSFALADASDLIAEAEKLNGEARAMNNAWVPTGKFIAAAKQAQTDGDTTAAMSAAERAVMLAKASLEQAEAERENWKNRQLVK